MNTSSKTGIMEEKDKDNTIGRTEAIFKLVLENNIELRMIRQLLVDQQTNGMSATEKHLFIENYNLELSKQSKEAENYLLGRSQSDDGVKSTTML